MKPPGLSPPKTLVDAIIRSLGPCYSRSCGYFLPYQSRLIVSDRVIVKRLQYPKSLVSRQNGIAWRNFEDIVDKARLADKYACYLVTMNGDSTIPEVATAQTYFNTEALAKNVHYEVGR